MTTKAEYLKKYLDSTGDKKKKRRIKKRTNLAVHDDDIDWRSLAPVNKDSNHSDKDESDLDEAPLVAEFKDDSVRKWQPVSRADTDAFENKSDDSNRNWEERNTIDVRKVRMDSPDFSPPRRKELSDVDDLSPPRRRKSLSSDLSPPRRDNKVEIQTKEDISPSQRRQRSSARGKKRRPQSPGVISSLGSQRFERQDSDGVLADHSLPKRQNRRDLSYEDHGVNITPHSQVQCTTVSTASINKTGLKNSEKLKLENKSANNQQEACYQGLDRTVSGKHAETVYRDKEGRKIDPKSEVVKKEQEERLMQEENEKFMLWGRGIAQTKSAQEKLQDDLYEMSKPLARYADDEDLERMLKEREREGDPMLAFTRKKTKKVQSSLSEKPKKEKPSFKGSAPPNRFGIRPGYRWDGVDRSNGFEKAWFSRESNKKAFNEEAYKWSVEDM